jgi:hypothetical protein
MSNAVRHCLLRLHGEDGGVVGDGGSVKGSQGLGRLICGWGCAFA